MCNCENKDYAKLEKRLNSLEKDVRISVLLSLLFFLMSLIGIYMAASYGK